MTNVKMTGRTDCTVSAWSHLPPYIKVLAHWFSALGSRPWMGHGIHPFTSLLASKIRQTFLSTSLASRLAFEQWAALPQSLSVTQVFISLQISMSRHWWKWRGWDYITYLAIKVTEILLCIASSFSKFPFVSPGDFHLISSHLPVCLPFHLLLSILLLCLFFVFLSSLACPTFFLPFWALSSTTCPITHVVTGKLIYNSVSQSFTCMTHPSQKRSNRSEVPIFFFS